MLTKAHTRKRLKHVAQVAALTFLCVAFSEWIAGHGGLWRLFSANSVARAYPSPGGVSEASVTPRPEAQIISSGRNG